MRLSPPFRCHWSGNARDRRRLRAIGLAPPTPTAPYVLHWSGEDALHRTLPPQPGCSPRSGSSLRARPCTAARPSLYGRDGDPADTDTTWASPFELMLSAMIGWQELCPAHHGSCPCALPGRNSRDLERWTHKETTPVSGLISYSSRSTPAGCCPDRETPGCTCQRRRRDR